MRRLLQLNIRAAKYDRALEIKNLCDKAGVALSPGMVAGILELMIRTKKLSEAESALHQMQKMYPQFTVDEHKVIDLVALVVESGDLNKARQILKERAKNTEVKGGPNLHKNVWQLLTNVASYAAKNEKTPTNQTKDFLQLLIELGYCTISNNALLGPIIREHLLRGEIREAIIEYTEIAKMYKKTPLQFELFSTLISISNSSDDDHSITAIDAKSLLEEVVKVTSQVHGSLNANVALVVAFAQSGTEKQLRKILIDPSVQVNMDNVIKQCEYLCNSGSFEPLLKLAKCSRGLSGSIREQDFYNLILSQHIRNNDYMAAITLFDRIVSDDEFKLTGDFSRNLITLLERNNMEIPSNVKMFSR